MFPVWLGARQKGGEGGTQRELASSGLPDHAGGAQGQGERAGMRSTVQKWGHRG